MPKTKVPRGTRRPDPEGEAWQAEAARRWDRAEQEATFTGDVPVRYYDPVPLPVFVGASHVTRQLFGRYLHDRDRNVVHDVTFARESCGIDAIRNGTFIHFASELDAELPPGVLDCSCMEDAS